MHRYNQAMRRIAPVALVLPLLALSASALGQSNANAPRQYHIEIIAYELTDGDRNAEDFFHGRERLRAPPSPGLYKLPLLELESVAAPVVGQTQPPLGPQQDPATAPGNPLLADRLELFETSAGTSTPEVPAPDSFRPLAADELELGAERATLERLSAYRVLAHSGWVQTGLDLDLAVPLDLKLLGVSNPRGTIQVYLSSYLHALVDLEFIDGRGSFWRSSYAPGLNTFEYAGRYQLQFEQNRIGLGSLVYIDHPLFGLILRIIRAPEPAAEEPTGRPAA